MMNENYELSISEWNTQPGLENVPVRMDNGVLNPHNITSNAVNVGVINDVLTKLGNYSFLKTILPISFFSPTVQVLGLCSICGLLA